VLFAFESVELWECAQVKVARRHDRQVLDADIPNSAVFSRVVRLVRLGLALKPLG
jgi:hypothetical protein